MFQSEHSLCLALIESVKMCFGFAEFPHPYGWGFLLLMEIYKGFKTAGQIGMSERTKDLVMPDIADEISKPS